MKRRFLLALMVVILGLIVVGCDSAGAGGGGSDTTQDETPDDGSGDGGSGDNGTSVPSDVPSDSTGAVDGTAYGYLELDYYGDDGFSGGYNTDLALYPDSDSLAPQFYIELWDGTDTVAIDAGTYTVDAGGSDDSDGSITWVDILGAADGSTLSYAASTEGTKSAFESGWGASVDVYDQITGGTVTISVSGSVYTVAWSLDTADGDTLAGSYTGSVDETFDET